MSLKNILGATLIAASLGLGSYVAKAEESAQAIEAQQTEIKGLENIVDVIFKLGYPSNLRQTFRPEEVATIHSLLVERSAWNSYVYGNENNDDELMKTASEKLLEVDVYSASNAGDLFDDKELLLKAGWKLVETDPYQAYWSGTKADNNELIEAARKGLIDDALADYDPIWIYQIWNNTQDEVLMEKFRGKLLENPTMDVDILQNLAYKYNDMTLLNKLGWALLEENPLQAYQYGLRTKDEKLINAVGWKALEKFPGLAYNAGKGTKDKELMNKAGWLMFEHKDPYVFNPRFIYEAGLKTNDDELMLKAESRWAEEKPFSYYREMYGELVANSNLIEVARDNMLETNPDRAYKTGKRMNDEVLVDRALTAISNSKGIDLNLLKQLYN